MPCKMSHTPPPRAQRSGRKWLQVAALLAVAGLAWWGIVRWRAGKLAEDDDSVISALVMSEETYLTLSPEMARLSADFMELTLPGPKSRELFAGGGVEVTDAAPQPAQGNAAALVFRDWPMMTTTATMPGSEVKLWSSLTASVAWFSHSKIYLIRGEHPGADQTRFNAKAGFDALACMKSGEWTSLSGHMDLEWVKTGEAWHITAWHTRDIQFANSPERLFIEALNEAVPSEEARTALRHEIHNERY